MKTFIIVLSVAVVVAQLTYARSVAESKSESLESVEAEHEILVELAEIKHDLKVLQKRFHDLEYSLETSDLTSSTEKPSKKSRQEKRINEKSLGDFVNFLGDFLVG